jgi:hypothetical protein
MKGAFLGFLVSLLLGAPATVQAQFEYTTNAGGTAITITNYTGLGGAVNIPANINGLPVSSIVGSLIPVTGSSFHEKSAFSDCSILTSVTIPNSVTIIGDRAFAGCTNLTSVTIPDSVTSIGEDAFVDCSSLTSVTIPDSVTSLAKNAFCFCTNLASVTIPDSVTNIGIQAFCECHSLTNAIIGNSVTSIEKSAFRNCHKLKGVYFKGNAPSLGLIAVFFHDRDAIVYYLPGTTGWNPTTAPNRATGCKPRSTKPRGR